MVRVHAGPQEGGLAQLARATALHAVGHRFDSDTLHKKREASVNRKKVGLIINSKT